MEDGAENLWSGITVLFVRPTAIVEHAATFRYTLNNVSADETFIVLIKWEKGDPRVSNYHFSRFKGFQSDSRLKSTFALKRTLK